MSCGCIVVPTLQYMQDEEQRDLVDEALAKATIYSDYSTAVHDRIWQDYRYRMFGTCNPDMFVQILADRLNAESLTAIAAMDAVAGVGAQLAAIGGTRTVVTSTHTDTVGGGTDTLSRLEEDMPDNSAVSSYQYPAAKNKDTSVIADRTNVYGEVTVTENSDRSKTELLRDVMDALRDPLDALMRAISGCWLNRW